MQRCENNIGEIFLLETYLYSIIVTLCRSLCRAIANMLLICCLLPRLNITVCSYIRMFLIIFFDDSKDFLFLGLDDRGCSCKKKL